MTTDVPGPSTATERGRRRPADPPATTSSGRGSTTSREPALPLLLRQLLPGSVLVVLTARMLQPVRDPDTFWHLATGDRLRETWTFSGPDPWSSMSTEPWRLHEWLPELLMSLTQQAFGLPGVAWLLPLGAGVIGVLLWWWLRRSAGLLVTALVMVVALVAMSGSLSLRPHLVSFALTVVTVGTWLRTVDDGRPRWWLIALTWLWACSHGMWFVGVVVGGVVVVGMWLDGLARGRAFLRLAAVPLGSALAAAVTPVGPGLLLTPLAVSGTTQYIDEWKPPSLRHIGFLCLLLLVAVAAVVWLRRGVRVPWTRLLLLGLGLAFALLYVRTIPIGAAIVAPLAATAAHQALGVRREPVARREVALTAGLTAAGLLVAGLAAPSQAAQADWGPSGLDPAIAALPKGTVLCNDYGIGGWLIWRHPNVRPAIDGRTEVYSLDHVRSYMDFHQAVPGWQKYLEQTGCSWALVPTDQPAFAALEGQAHWTVSARHDRWALLEAPR